MEAAVELKKQKTSYEKDERSSPMGIAFMVADSTLKHYSQDQSSVKINSYLSVPTLVGDVSEKVADAVMKN